jgi:hypothetical protein
MLQVPVEWYEHVARYDDLHFDYHALESMRRDRSKPRTFTFMELLRCQRDGLEHDPIERFHPYPAEVVANREVAPAYSIGSSGSGNQGHDQ